MHPSSVGYWINREMNAESALTNSKRIWSIILAGGNGDRIGDLTRRWMGRPVPKQYCTFVGNRSMLQHTLLRAEKLGSRERQLILIARAHQEEARSQLADRWSNEVLIQPANRDTLPGIFLPLTYAYARDPNATLAIYPSDHFIYPINQFVRTMERAVQAAEELPHMLIIIGVPANSIELEYGWILPGHEIWRSGEYSVQAVKKFMEKPSRADAMAARACGCLWNTFIMVTKAETLWRIGWNYAPKTLKHFEQLYGAIGTVRESSVLESIYETMPVKNFSAHLLAQAVNQVGAMPMENVLWSDWGRAERILETLRIIRKKASFPMTLLAGNAEARTQEISLEQSIESREIRRLVRMRPHSRDLKIELPADGKTSILHPKDPGAHLRDP